MIPIVKKGAVHLMDVNDLILGEQSTVVEDEFVPPQSSDPLKVNIQNSLSEMY